MERAQQAQETLTLRARERRLPTVYELAGVPVHRETHALKKGPIEPSFERKRSLWRIRAEEEVATYSHHKTRLDELRGLVLKPARPLTVVMLCFLIPSAVMALGGGLPLAITISAGLTAAGILAALYRYAKVTR